MVDADRNETRLKTYKIALLGTTRVGKSTVINNLKGLFRYNRRVEIIPEAATEYFFYNQIPEFIRQTVEVQGVLQDFVYAKEMEASFRNRRIYITDRSVLDAPVYVRVGGDREGSERLYNKYLGWLGTYTKFVLLSPKEVPHEQSEYHPEDEIMRLRIHQEYLDFLDEKTIPYQLIGGSEVERIQQVEDLVFDHTRG